jgi:uncharacterized phage protein (TIGR01671 family)
MGKFKFRAFNKKHKEMVYDTEHFAVNDLNNENENWTQAMQYTGLKDKNGKEIYEGDIIQAFNASLDNEKGNNEVIFDNGCFKLRKPNVNDIPIGSYKQNEIGVIGNIYEHPHLLEGES